METCSSNRRLVDVGVAVSQKRPLPLNPRRYASPSMKISPIGGTGIPLGNFPLRKRRGAGKRFPAFFLFQHSHIAPLPHWLIDSRFFVNHARFSFILALPYCHIGSLHIPLSRPKTIRLLDLAVTIGQGAVHTEPVLGIT